MSNNRTSTFSNGLIWFGAGVSIAEILTGTYFAPLGFTMGIAAILLGHLIGGSVMFAAGLIGGLERKSAMETVGMSFGFNGCKFFATLNVIQLIGWTAIMIYDGAIAANGIFNTGMWIWAVLIGGLIILWILIGLTHLGKVNMVAMGALFILSLILFKVVFFGKEHVGIAQDESFKFGAAVELAATMPLSWLPLISDYTREAEKPVAATVTSVVTYNIVSIFMYIVGMGASILTGETDISLIMVKAGLGIAGLLIIVLSTVTTTFLDAYSAGISSVSISKRLSGKHVAIGVTVIGILAAIFFPLANITGFLYFIGSVFAPMVAIQIADYFIMKKPAFTGSFNLTNFLIWVAGFGIYRLLMKIETPVGNTLIDMIITVIICVVVHKIAGINKTREIQNEEH